VLAAGGWGHVRACAGAVQELRVRVPVPRPRSRPLAARGRHRTHSGAPVPLVRGAEQGQPHRHRRGKKRGAGSYVATISHGGRCRLGTSWWWGRRHWRQREAGLQESSWPQSQHMALFSPGRLPYTISFGVGGATCCDALTWLNAKLSSQARPAAPPSLCYPSSPRPRSPLLLAHSHVHTLLRRWTRRRPGRPSSGSCGPRCRRRP